MKAIVVFDSNYGNTLKVAEVVAEILSARIVSVKSFKASDLKDIGLLVLGSPIIGWKPTVPTSELLSKLGKDALDGIKATAFDTRVKLFIHGDAKEKMAKELKRLGAEIFIQPEAFYVAGPQTTPYLLDGELERAEKWAKEILKRVQDDVNP